MATAQEMQFRVELNEPLVTQTMLGVLQQGDAKANVIRIAVYDGGMHTPAALEGNEVSGYFQREDGERVLLEGSISGNVVSVVLNENCYAISGSYGAFVRLTNKQNGAKRTILRIAGQVESEGGGPIIDPGNRIPSIDDVIAQLAKMEEAIEKAENAANNVGDAAENAQSAATTANNAASTANEAAGNAKNATTNANNATERANTAAAALETAPVPTGTVVTYQAGTSATTPPTGTWLENPPTVPQGQYLWTRTVQSFTNGDPVISYSVARQGMDGSGSVSSVNGVAPDASGNVQIDVGGNVQTVNGVAPDTDGNVQLTPDKVGALPAGGTAVDAAKLGGKAPEYYIQPRNLLDNSDFTNPVNQRGITSLTASSNVYTIDRWRLDNGKTITVNENSITLDGGWLTQYIGEQIDPAKTYTAAALLDDGTLIVETGVPADKTRKTYFGFDVTAAGVVYIGIRVAGTYKWAALYDGSYTADTLPPYVPKENELAASMRRFINFVSPSNAKTGYSGYAHSDKEARIVIPLPSPMAVLASNAGEPSVTFTNLDDFRIVCNGNQDIVPTSISAVGSLRNNNGDIVAVTLSLVASAGGLTAGHTCLLKANGGSFSISTDL